MIVLISLVIAGPDPSDNYTLVQPSPVPDYTKSLNKNALNGVRIGVPRKVFTNNTITGNLPFINEAFEEAIQTIKSLGATVIDPADLPSADYFAQINPELFIFAIDFKVRVHVFT